MPGTNTTTHKMDISVEVSITKDTKIMHHQPFENSPELGVQMESNLRVVGKILCKMGEWSGNYPRCDDCAVWVEVRNVRIC